MDNALVLIRVNSSKFGLCRLSRKSLMACGVVPSCLAASSRVTGVEGIIVLSTLC